MMMMLITAVLLAVSISLSSSQDCPAVDSRCSCVRDFFTQRLVCQRLDYVDRLPSFNRSTTVYASLTVRESTAVRRVQARAFDGLRVNTLNLQSLFIESIDVDAFLGLDADQLTEIQLGDNNIQSVPAGTFRSLSSLSVLGLQQNAIRQLDPTLFRGLTSLSYLHLDGNQIASLPDGLLRDLRVLRELYLFHNELSEISTTALRGLSGLRKLQLNGNKLRRVAVGAFGWLGELRELRLQDNQLGPVINFAMFDGLFQLEILDISNNFLSSLPSNTFVHTPRLRHVYLNNNQLRTVGEMTFANLSRLATLRLDGNRLTSLPDDWLKGSTSLTSLYLQQNHLRLISNRTFRGLRSLRSLFLSQNRIQRLHDGSFQHLTSLTSLDMNDNLIENMSPVLLRHNTRLSSLHLRNNRLEAVPNGVFRDLPSLRYLYMADNRIESLDNATFSNLRSLIYLELSRNRIATIRDGAFVNLPNIFSLLLDRNNIRTLSTSVLSKLSNLRTIYLSHNRLTTVVNGTFTGLENLQRLFLTNNHITVIEPGTFSDLKMLQTLDLSFNNISVLSWDLFSGGPARLRLLNLSHNSLVDLGDQRLRGLVGLSSLDLSFNSLTAMRSENFIGLTSLSTLLLDQNRLSTLSDMAFNATVESLSELSLASNLLPSSSVTDINGLRSLSTVVLDNNPIDRLPVGTFSHCPSLSSLSLRHNAIKSLDAIVSDSVSMLRHLDIGYNRLNSTTLRDLGRSFPHLESLRLDGNGFTRLPQSMFQSPKSSIVELDLSSNRLRSQNVFSCLLDLTTVSVLRLDRNLIDVIPADLTTPLSRSVTKLSLRSNRLTSDGIAALYNFTRLTELRLDVNRIVRFPSAIFRRMFYLQTLSASDNHLQQLNEGSFSGASRTLMSLSLADNQIYTVSPMTFARMTAIRDLDLSDNQITHMTLPAIMSQLNRLSLSENRLSTFPSGLRYLPLLQRLDVADNHLTRLPALIIQNYATTMSVNFADNFLRDVDSLRLAGIADRVDFSGNYLRRISPTSNLLVAVNVASEVDFSRNMFTEVPAVVSDSLDVIHDNLTFYSNRLADLDNWRVHAERRSTVRNVVLRRNVITQLPANVTASLRASLVHLDVRDNLLTTLDHSEFLALKELNQLDIRFNQLNCDCRLAWLRQLAQSVRVDMATCYRPRALVGQSVLCYNITDCDDVTDDIRNIIPARCGAFSSSPLSVSAVLPVLAVVTVVLSSN